VTVGSSTVRDPDHGNSHPDNYKSAQKEIGSWSSDLSARTNNRWIQERYMRVKPFKSI
jgi:hypothetical protein